MTITATYTPDSYTGDASTVIFPYTFKIFAEADLRVILVDTSVTPNTETVQTITTHYTVSGVGVAGGGNVTMVTAPAATEDLVIKYNLGITQPYDYTDNDPFPAATHENALDRRCIIDQQMDEILGRVPRFAESSSQSDVILGEPTALYLLRWNAAGTGIEAVDSTTVMPAIIDLENDTPIRAEIAAGGSTFKELISLDSTDTVLIDNDGMNAIFGGNVSIGPTFKTWYTGRDVLQMGERGSLFSHSSGGEVRLSNNWYINGSGSNVRITTGYVSQILLDSLGGIKLQIATTGAPDSGVTFTEALAIDTAANIAILAAKKLYFDGGTHTYITESGADIMDFYTGGVLGLKINAAQGVHMPALKSGATQVAAGAAANELWVTSGHATQEDNTVMIGV